MNRNEKYHVSAITAYVQMPPCNNIWNLGENKKAKIYNCTPFQKTKVGMSFIHRKSADVAAPLSHPIWAQIPKCNL